MFYQKKFTNLELHKKIYRSLKDLTLLHIICFYKILDYKIKSLFHRRSDERGSTARMATASEEAHRDTGSDGRDDGQADWDFAVLGSPVL